VLLGMSSHTGSVNRDIHGCISSVGAPGQWELFEDVLVSVGCHAG
jgi:hypothetical protein